MYLDSESLFINLDFDTSTSPIRYINLKIVSLSREVDFDDFGANNFHRSQIQGIFIYVMTSGTYDEKTGLIYAKQK